MAGALSGDYLDVDGDGNLILRLWVLPGAGRSAVVGRHGDALKVKVAAPPTQGRANEACVALLATSLGVAASAVELVGGAASRAKRLLVRGVEPDDARRLLAALADDGLGPARPGNAGSPRGVR
jgi:uncharacterized protein